MQQVANLEYAKAVVRCAFAHRFVTKKVFQLGVDPVLRQFDGGVTPYILFDRELAFTLQQGQVKPGCYGNDHTLTCFPGKCTNMPVFLPKTSSGR